ncbi:polyprenyl synthetase family protein [Tomitella cavernea]|uniref:polyprenyl synthetase family protein n=1 Tax=Tomitella cavernea TaxID=1387982 RepID=UPI0027DC9D27|nr:polyprenyl synthetase family protein [Tomitella cavernea]
MVSTDASTDTIVAGVDLGDPDFAARIRARMVESEELLIAELSVGEDFLTEPVLHLASAGGKRFRPLFTLLSSEFGPDPDNMDVITSAVVLELVHLATLYHDDVMDEAAMRRGAESANSKWSNSVAILSGDYLFAQASRLVSTLGPSAVEMIALTFAELVTGQMRETVGARRDDPVRHYLDVIGEKTGSLIAAAGTFGGRFSRADDERCATLHRLGAAVGMAFQISDDIIDITSASDQSGKTPGTDLREGVHTLPVLYALAGDGPDAARLRVLLDGPVVDDATLAEALELLGSSDGMSRAKATLADYARQAREELATLPDGPANRALSSLVEYTTARVG